MKMILPYSVRLESPIFCLFCFNGLGSNAGNMRTSFLIRGTGLTRKGGGCFLFGCFDLFFNSVGVV